MLAYLITFGCYGRYFPGQAGTVDRQHNVYGLRPPEPRPALELERTESAVQRGFRISAHQRPVVLEVIRTECIYRGWTLFAAHVRSTHVHVIVQAEDRPEKVMNVFKSYASRALNSVESNGSQSRRWARHGSTRYLWSRTSLDAAISDVLDQQGKRMSWFELERRTDPG